ncbi:MAG: hypothetical protein V1849_04695 [Chloroflexota bacterium]
MRTLTQTLSSAQKQRELHPCVKVEVSPKRANLARLTWSRLYEGTEPDCYHGAAVDGQGSLHRARIHPTTFMLYRQKVPSPGPGSDFSQWTQVETAYSQGACALAANGANLLLFFVEPTSPYSTIHFLKSTDYGVTWSRETLTPAAGAVNHLAAAIADNGAALLIYSVGAGLYRRWGSMSVSGSGWGDPSQVGLTYNEWKGFTVIATPDPVWWYAVFAAVNSSGEGCLFPLTIEYEAGVREFWTKLSDIITASANSQASYSYPSLDKPDSAASYRLSFQESYSGTQTYNRIYLSHTVPGSAFASNLWREPFPFNLQPQYGARLAHDTTCLWMTTPSGVWRAPLSSSATALTSDVLSVQVKTIPTQGKALVELRNDNGQYVIPNFAAGDQLDLSWGYRTTLGEEVSSGPQYWIEGWEYLSQEAKSSLVITAYDGWGLLEASTLRRQITWAIGNYSVKELIQTVLARAGLKLEVLSQSDLIQNLKPYFTIYPGQDLAQAMKQLLGMVTDVLFFRGSTAYLKHPRSTDAAEYTYGTEPAAHVITEGRYRKDSWGVNRAQVYGDSIMVEKLDWAQIEKLEDRIRQVHDKNIDTVTKAEQRAETELREAELLSQKGEIAVPLNCGQELYDVIEITDPRTGQGTQQRRCLALSHSFVPQKAKYQLEIALGAK